MIRGLVLLAGVALIGGAAYWFMTPAALPVQLCPAEDSRTAPSGRELALCDVVYEVQPNDDVWAVVRVVDQGLVTNAGRDDHDWACRVWGLPVADKDPSPNRIVVQLMAEPFERGEPTPGITQSIEAYSISDGTCEWELL